LNDEGDETERQRKRHVERCLDARMKSGGGEGGHGEWEIDDEGDDYDGTENRDSRWENGKAGDVEWNGGVGTKFEVKGTPRMTSLSPVFDLVLPWSRSDASPSL